MRNLKRALSLALASVMLLGMMVVGTSAASYPDVDENDNVEAIEVLNAVNVMIGRQGNFEPDEAVNRHEMAVIMAKLVLGVDTADNYVGTHPFTDVVPWADKYVAACYENGLVAGTSATTYGGGNPLTAVQAAAMMLRALGYKDLSVGATDWRAPVTAMANQIRLFDGVASNPSERLNRNQVAQLALNTLKSPMVNLKDNTISWTNGDGQIIMTGGSREYIVLSSREAYAQAINDVESQGTSASAIGGWTVELGEHLYNGKLKLNNRDTDVFMRPARTWEYDGKQIGTYVKEELLRETYTTEVTGKTLYNLLTKNTIDDYDFTIAIDGVEATEANYNVLNGFGYFTRGNLVNTNTRGVGATGKGVTTEVYVDSVNKEVYIAVINTYLAKASEDYNERRDEVRFNIWAVDAKNRNTLVKDKSVNTVRTVSAEDFDDSVKDFKKDDIVLVRVADNEIQEIIQPEVISETTLSSFSKTNWVNNGTKYDYANTAKYDTGVLDVYDFPNMKEVTYDLYLDTYGYLIGIERNEDPDQYVFLAGVDAGSSNLKASTADVNIIHVDGTMETVKADMNKSYLPSFDGKDKNGNTYGYVDANGKQKNRSQLNTWCKYSVSNSGVYTLTEITYNAGADTLGQFAQSVDQHHDNTTGAPVKAITEKRTSLIASTAVNDSTAIRTYVYGSIVTGADVATDRRMIVDDVDAVITGIKDVDLEMEELGALGQNTTGGAKYNNPDNEIYTLYKEGIVIAAVTIGEDNGTSATWAYVTSVRPRQEDYEHVTDSNKAAQPGEWTWYREAIVDGKITDLVCVGDELEYIGNPDEDKGNNIMEQGEWYEVKLAADGTVRKAEHLSTAIGARYLTASMDVEEQVNTSNGDVALHMMFLRGNFSNDEDDLSFKNGNLYTNKDQTKGFSVSRNVKVALGQAQLVSGADNGTSNPNDSKDTVKNYGDHGIENYVKQFDTVDDTFEGYDGLKAALDRLDANFVGDLNVIFENGAATVIIINDIWGEYINEGEYIGNKDNVSGDASIKWITGVTWELTVPADANVSTIARIADYMAKAGCTDIVYTRQGWNFSYEGVRNENQDINIVRKNAETHKITKGTTVNGTFTVNAEAQTGETVTIEATPVAGYEVDTVTVRTAGGTNVTVSGTGNTRTFKMPNADVTVTVTFKSTTVVGTPVTVTFDANGTAKSPKHYTVEGLVDGKVEMKSGEKLTITAEKDIYVHVNGGAAKKVAEGDSYTVEITADTTIYINRHGFVADDDNNVSLGEDWGGKTPFAATAVVGKRFSLARSAADGFYKIYFQLTSETEKTAEYVVKIPATGSAATGPWNFGKGIEKTKLVNLLNQLNDCLDDDVIPVGVDTKVEPTNEEKAAWAGTGTTDPDGPGTGKIWLTVNFPTGWTVKYNESGSLSPSTDKEAKSGGKIAIREGRPFQLRVLENSTDLIAGKSFTATNATVDVSDAGKLVVNSNSDVTVDITAKANTSHTLNVRMTDPTNPLTSIVASRGTGNDRALTLASNGDCQVFAGETVTVTVTAAGSNAVAELQSEGKTGAKQYVTVTNTSGAVSFKMPADDFSLTIGANGGVITDRDGNSAVVANSQKIVAFEGVEATWTSADKKETRTIASNAETVVPSQNGTITITKAGKGTSVFAGTTAAATSAATGAAVGGKITLSGASDVYLIPASKITLVGDSTSAGANAGNLAGTKKGASMFVKVGEKVTFTGGAGISFVADDLAGKALEGGKLTVAGKDTTVYGAFKVGVDTNVTAKFKDTTKYGDTTVVGGAGKALFVPAGETITMTNVTSGRKIAKMGTGEQAYVPAASDQKAITELKVTEPCTLKEVTPITFVGAPLTATWDKNSLTLGGTYTGSALYSTTANSGAHEETVYAVSGIVVMVRTDIGMTVTGQADTVASNNRETIFKVGTTPVRVVTEANPATSRNIESEAELAQAIADKVGTVNFLDDITFTGVVTIPEYMTVNLNGWKMTMPAQDLTVNGKIITGKDGLVYTPDDIVKGDNISGNIELYDGSATLDKYSATANVTMSGAAKSLTSLELPAGAKITVKDNDLTIDGAAKILGTIDTGSKKLILGTGAAATLEGGKNITGTVEVGTTGATIDGLSENAALNLSAGPLTINGEAKPSVITTANGALTVAAGGSLYLPDDFTTGSGAVSVGPTGKLFLQGHTLTLGGALTIDARGTVDAAGGTVSLKAQDVTNAKNIVNGTILNDADNTTNGLDGLAESADLIISADLKITGNVTFKDNSLTWTTGAITINGTGGTATSAVVTLNGAATAMGVITVTAGTLKLGGDLTLATGDSKLVTTATKGLVNVNGYQIKGAAAGNTVTPVANCITGLTADNSNFYATATTSGNVNTSGHTPQATADVTAVAYTWTNLGNGLFGWVANS